MGNNLYPPVEPQEVAELVERYVETELSNAAKFDNCTPLDESGIYSLHRLGAELYALGHESGERVADARNRGRDNRKRDEADHG